MQAVWSLDCRRHPLRIDITAAKGKIKVIEEKRERRCALNIRDPGASAFQTMQVSQLIIAFFLHLSANFTLIVGDKMTHDWHLFVFLSYLSVSTKNALIE